MYLLTFLYLSIGIILIWKAAESLEKNAVLTAKKFNISPFIIGSTVIALGTSAPELFTTLFAALNGQGTMIIGNVIGSNIANLSLVFGITIFILGLKRKEINENSSSLSLNLLLLILSTLLVIIILIFNPFSFFSSSIFLLSFLGVVIFLWSRMDKDVVNEGMEPLEFNPLLRLIFSILFLCLGSWLIVKGANSILRIIDLGEMFVGFTIIAIGTSLPEIAASVSLSMKGRYQAVAGTLIGSNIFNSLLVLSIPGFFNNPTRFSVGWSYDDWTYLLITLFIITIIFSLYMKFLNRKTRKASTMLGVLFITSYFISLVIAYN